MFSEGDKIGPYTLLRRIGQGSFGEVWLAKRLGQLATIEVALKFPIKTDVDLDAIKKEASLWVQACGHPNVLPIVDADLYDGHVVIASEYAPDGTLEQWLKRSSEATLSLKMAAEMVVGILNGLEHLHRKGIIHRDLKPANILLQDTTPRLADFGLSQVIKTQSEVSTGTVAGTPAYMAPEAFKGKRNVRTDLWAVGVIFYQLVSGQLPFTEKDLYSLMTAIREKPPAPLGNHVPFQVRKLIEGWLSKSPSHRPANAGQMRDQLLEVMKHWHEPRRSRRWVKWAVPLAVLAVLGLLLLMPLLFRRGPGPELSTYRYETVRIGRSGNVVERPTGEARYFAEDLGGGVVLEMVAIPPGSFQMGSLQDEPGYDSKEYPRHNVTVPGFYIGKFEVTQAQWRAVVGDGNSLNPPPSPVQGNNLPVVNVSWDDARNFCVLLSGKTGRNYRLPSEAEWEYACRARTTTPFAFGDSITPEVVNYDSTLPFGGVLPQAASRRKAIEVGSLKVANGFGLYDMPGNVWEWCEDSAHPNYRGNNLPLDGSAWTEGGTKERVVRGGAWDKSAVYCRCAYRFSFDPSTTKEGTIGFRVVADMTR